MTDKRFHLLLSVILFYGGGGVLSLVSAMCKTSMDDSFFKSIHTFFNQIPQKVYLILYFSKIAIYHPLNGRLGRSRPLLVTRLYFSTNG
jgi:hypothetical protein